MLADVTLGHESWLRSDGSYSGLGDQNWLGDADRRGSADGLWSDDDWCHRDDHSGRRRRGLEHDDLCLGEGDGSASGLGVVLECAVPVSPPVFWQFVVFELSDVEG